ncbi:MAG TPA: FMN-binding glutamate synthase family protein, partial [Stellaceae bacterium]|nr:FMN-binding glutamate synthase family protein [Stellaceae bacterium]
MRYVAIALSILGVVVCAALIPFSSVFIVPFAIAAILSAIGVWDIVQKRHSIRRNYPILANIRFGLEKVRPEIRQYFLESDQDGTPFNRSKRAVAYQRAKGDLDKRPFGTQQDVYGRSFEWMNHSLAPRSLKEYDFRVQVGGAECRQPHSLSLFNISAMSFGALSANAIRALNKGAKLGGFAHDTGEGGYSDYHREFGGDIIWEIGSGYFGCRNPDGSFWADGFARQAADPQVKMIEIKLSQGAKPGHGGVLPGAKVTAEIAAARGVPIGVDCVSPARHSAFGTPLEMVRFIAQLRELSGGKPVGFKLCIGHPWEFMAICKAMLETGIRADFIVIDGTEGGTGAAPLEFVDHVGTPLREGLVFAHNCLVGAGLRPSIRLGAAGRIVTAFDMARVLALGADWCNAARGFMFALGCIQSQSCHTDRCPTGVATQDPLRQYALVVPDKAERVRMFHHSTLKALGELVGAAGLGH